MEKINFRVRGRRFFLEPVKKTDIRKCAGIFANEFNRTYKGKWTVKKAESRIKQCLKRYKLCFTIKEGKKTIGLLLAGGFFWYDGMHCYIDELVLKRKYQGKGVGTTALKAFEKFLKERGSIAIELLSMKGSRAMKIWKKQGYKESNWAYLEKELK